MVELSTQRNLIVGLDLRKTKIRPKYVPNPTDDSVPYSALFRITGACYFGSSVSLMVMN